jgi:hypothetical protein
VDTIAPELTVNGVKAFQKLCSVKISSIFSEALVDEYEYVHILVQAPPGALHKCFFDLKN